VKPRPAVVLPVLLLALTACTGDDPVVASPSPTPSVLPGTSDDGFVGAREDVSGLDCRAREEGGWSVAGTVTNPTAGPVDYRVYVALLDASGSRTVVQVDVEDVGPGEQRAWRGAADVDGEDLRCVLRVERVPG
jgi:hypothetical protein